ncbi:MAG TPA: RraA family protein [Ramlibacter sp.]|nr:RraA family protein [Ramlibacter sp.]
MHDTLARTLRSLTGPHLADGCLRCGVPIRTASAALRPLVPGMECRGSARPVRHSGSIDVFLEVLEQVRPGDVLVVDNGGRTDEACIGDIVLLEAQAAGVAGIVIWGLLRDATELRAIGFPVFSLGALPTGPRRLDARPADAFTRAMVGQHAITAEDVVVADANGVLFLPRDGLEHVVSAAASYRDTEARQLQAMHEGRSYREQSRFAEYLEKRRRDPEYGFRQHLKAIAAAGEV